MRSETHQYSAETLSKIWPTIWSQVKDFKYKLLGKPFGCTPILESLHIKDYPYSVLEHRYLDEFIYCEQTLGNSLGIAIGIAIASPSEKVFVLLSDAQLYMGKIYESMQLIEDLKIDNIYVAIDINYRGSKEMLDIKNNFLIKMMENGFKCLKIL